MPRRDTNNARAEFKLPAAVLQAIDRHCAARKVGRSDWLRKAAQKVMREEVLKDHWAEQRRELDKLAAAIAGRPTGVGAGCASGRVSSVRFVHTTPFQRTKRTASTKRTDSPLTRGSVAARAAHGLKEKETDRCNC